MTRWKETLGLRAFSLLKIPMLFFVSPTVIRGASGTMLPEPGDRAMQPFVRPPTTVVTAAGKGRRPARCQLAAPASSVTPGQIRSPKSMSSMRRTTGTSLSRPSHDGVATWPSGGRAHSMSPQWARESCSGKSGSISWHAFQ